MDNYDGTGSVIGSGSVDTNNLGTYSITYDHTDTEGNVGIQATRTVNVIAGNPPVLTILGDNPLTLEVFTSYTESGATALDAEE